MSVLLFVVGALTLIVGVGAIGFGIPINEFSFGNTLIIAGMTATVGGLIVIALGAIAAQLHRIHETLASGAVTRPARAAGTFEATVPERVPAGGMPFPARLRPDAPIPGPPPAALPPGLEPAEELSGSAFEPMLRNPEAPLTAEGEAALSPLHGGATAPPSYGRNGSTPGERGYPPPPETAYELGWRPPPQPSPEPRSRATNFDAMWPPARPRPEMPSGSSPDQPREPVGDNTVQASPVVEPAAAMPVAPPATEEKNAPRAAAILKSGVVEGMGYTLYVDGSIEAELPRGTLRFASIDELRSHLEKNS
jgi:hypothetical protein